MTSPAPLLGIDLGTQSVKVAAIRDGVVIASATRAYPVSSPHPGWAQTDPVQWREAVDSAAADVIAQTGPPAAVGLSGQMHGVVATGAELQALTPGIVWADGRSVDQAQRMSADLGSEHLARLGSSAFPGFLGPTAAWLWQHEPEIASEIRWLLPAKDFLRATLTGEVATDGSDASGTLLLDVIDRAWDPEALAVCGITEVQLPPIEASDAAAGVIASGPLRGTPVCVGGADTACVIHGLGLSAGEGYVGLGTGSQIVAVLDEPLIDPSVRTHTFLTVATTSGAAGMPASTGWYRMAAVQSGGLALSRALTWMGASVPEAQAALAQGVRPDDPIFLPFVAGERSPFLDPELRASWTGLSLATDRPALLRSVLEGMAFAAAAGGLALGSVLPAGPLPVVGGGSRDSDYLRVLAGLLDRALLPVDTSDAAVIGAARLAGSMQGLDVEAIRATGSPAIEPVVSPLTTERFAQWQATVDERLGT